MIRIRERYFLFHADLGQYALSDQQAIRPIWYYLWPRALDYHWGSAMKYSRIPNIAILFVIALGGNVEIQMFLCSSQLNARLFSRCSVRKAELPKSYRQRCSCCIEVCWHNSGRWERHIRPLYLLQLVIGIGNKLGIRIDFKLLRCPSTKYIFWGYDMCWSKIRVIYCRGPGSSHANSLW